MVTRYMAWRSTAQGSAASRLDGCHFWNLVYLNGQCYHCDSSPSFEHDGYWYMRTDDELDWSHRFDIEGDLPPRATESVLDQLDFYNMTMREDETDE